MIYEIKQSRFLSWLEVRMRLDGVEGEVRPGANDTGSPESPRVGVVVNF